MTEEIAAPEGGSVSAKGVGSGESAPATPAEAATKALRDQTDKLKPQFVDSVTPSGIEVRYHWAPKRKYELRRHFKPGDISGSRKYHMKSGSTTWEEVPSVTTVLDCLSKPGLTWWGQGIGLTGVLTLVERGLLIWKE